MQSGIPRKTFTRTARSSSPSILAIFLLALFGAVTGQPAAPQKDKIVAMVNHTPIYEHQVLEGIPANAFAFEAEQAKRAKLQRLIDTLVNRQFLDEHQIKVPREEIDREVDYLRKNPPSMGCPCCSYASLDEFLKSNYYTLDEFRNEISVSKGIDRYLDQLWDKEHQDKLKNQALTKTERPRMEKDFIKASHIFFNTFQQPGFAANPEIILDQKKEQANAAWKRLKNGESFTKLVKELSDDKNSKRKDGRLGCISKYAFGYALTKLDKTLKPGEFSKPVESPYGFHIFMIEPMNDADILGLLKNEFVTSKGEEIMDQIKAKSVIKKFDAAG